MKRALFAILTLVAMQIFATEERSRTLDLQCKTTTAMGPENYKKITLESGMGGKISTMNPNIGTHINFNALHDYVTLEAWDTVSGAYAKTEAYQISITKKIYLQAADQNKKKLYFHFECEVE